jgi:BAH domain
MTLFPDSLDEDHDDGITVNKEDLSEKQQHQMKHRELFLSRQVETLPATHIRGKCTVTLLNETESLMSYLNREASNDPCLCSMIMLSAKDSNYMIFANSDIFNVYAFFLNASRCSSKLHL